MNGRIYVYMRLKFIARLLSQHWAEANNLRQIFVIKLIMMYTVDNATIIAANIITERRLCYLGRSDGGGG